MIDKENNLVGEDGMVILGKDDSLSPKGGNGAGLD